MEDGFQINSGGHIPQTPAASGQALGPVIEGTELKPEEQTMYQSGVGMLIHLMKWSCPEISYAVRELSKYMKKANRLHVVAMYHLFHQMLATKERGLVIERSKS